MLVKIAHIPVTSLLLGSLPKKFVRWELCWTNPLRFEPRVYEFMLNKKKNKLQYVAFVSLVISELDLGDRGAGFDFRSDQKIHSSFCS